MSPPQPPSLLTTINENLFRFPLGRFPPIVIFYAIGLCHGTPEFPPLLCGPSLSGVFCTFLSLIFSLNRVILDNETVLPYAKSIFLPGTVATFHHLTSSKGHFPPSPVSPFQTLIFPILSACFGPPLKRSIPSPCSSLPKFQACLFLHSFLNCHVDFFLPPPPPPSSRICPLSARETFCCNHDPEPAALTFLCEAPGLYLTRPPRDSKPPFAPLLTLVFFPSDRVFLPESTSTIFGCFRTFPEFYASGWPPRGLLPPFCVGLFANHPPSLRHVMPDKSPVETSPIPPLR